MKNKKITEATMKKEKEIIEERIKDLETKMAAKRAEMQKNLRDYFSTPKSPDYEKLCDNIRDYIGELEYRPNQYLNVQKVVTRLNSILRKVNK